MKTFDGKTVTIEELLKLNFYDLHIGQRRYEWDSDLIEDFITDIRDNTQGKDNRYFIGTTILIENKDQNGAEILTVVDGQQRITTLLLIIASLKERCDNYLQIEDNQDEKTKYREYIDLLNRLLVNNDITEEGVVKKLRLNVSQNDRIIFEKLITNEEIKESDIKTTSHEKLINAKDKIIDELERLEKDEIGNFIFALLKKVEIIRMKTSDEQTAFILFENVNRRLQELEPSDLIKNLFFKNINDEEKRDKLSNKWDEFINRLTPSKNNRKQFPSGINPTNFLKHYIMAKGIYIGKSGIYDYFLNLNLSDDEVVSELDELDKKSQKYIRYLKGEGIEALSNIKLLGLRQAIIVLLASANLSSSDFNEICDLLEKVAFCYTIGELRTNKLERKFTDISKDIIDGNLDNAKESLWNIIKNDKEVVLQALRTKSYNSNLKKKRVKYILVKIAKLLDGGNYDELTIEHIMPEEKSNDWNLCCGNDWFDDLEKYQSNVSNIGNLALLTRSDNSSIKGKAYTEKCKVYKRYARITSSLTEPIVTGTTNTKYDKLIRACPYSSTSVWGKNEIEIRAKWLSDLSEYIWFGKEIQ